MALFWRASILQPVILTLVCTFASTMCDDVEYASIEPNGAICPAITPEPSARSDIECAVTCTGDPNCRSFGYTAPLGEGSCLVSKMDNCTLMREGRTFRKTSDCKFSASGPLANGTTVMFMQRYIGDVNFARNWSDYDNGFGNCYGDFWLGLRSIKTLLGSTSATWRVEMTSWAGAVFFIEYYGFTVGDSSTNYTMTYDEMGNKSAAIVAAVVQKHVAFSTIDRDNDNRTQAPPCTELYNGNGGFWLANCGNAYPTAIFPSSQNTSSGYMVWSTGTHLISLKAIRMYLKR